MRRCRAALDLVYMTWPAMCTGTATAAMPTVLSVCRETLPEMARHTTFRFCLDPTVGQQEALARHAGAARFAFNQCLRTVKTAINARRADLDVEIPWTGFDLINSFNGWKKTEAAGRVITVDAGGVAEVVVTGLPWRGQVCQQVFEESAVDLGKGLKAWSDSRSGKRKGKRIGFPRFKKKAGDVPSFRLRNKHPKNARPAIRVGDHNRPRSVTFTPHPRPEPTTPENGGCRTLTRVARHALEPEVLQRNSSFSAVQNTLTHSRNSQDALAEKRTRGYRLVR